MRKLKGGKLLGLRSVIRLFKSNKKLPIVFILDIVVDRLESKHYGGIFHIFKHEFTLRLDDCLLKICVSLKALKDL